MGGRRRGVEYRAEHVRYADGSDGLLLVTDDGATEFRLARCPVPRDRDQDSSSWLPVRPEHPDERLHRADAYPGHVVLTSRAGGRNQLRILGLDDLAGEGIVVRPVSEISSLAAPEEQNVENDVDRIIVVDESYLLPPVWSDALARRPASGPSCCARRRRASTPRRTWGAAVVPVGRRAAVPATILRHRDTPLDGSAPCVMYAYGAYEEVYPDQEWDPSIPSLLDRGVVYVHAHVRGGGEGGRRWWLDGRMEHKQHTFDDHVAVADGLASAGLVDGSRIATRGLSRRRSAPGRGVLAAAGPLAGRRRRGAVRRRADHDARPDHPADRRTSGTSGATRRRPDGPRLDGPLLAVRQPAAGGIAARPPRHRRRSTTPGSWCGSRRSGSPGCARPTPSGRRAACSGSRPVPARTSARPAGSRTWATRPRSTRGSSTGLDY